MCIKAVKGKLDFLRKQWIDCSISELFEKRRSARLLCVSYFVSCVIVFLVFFELYWETRVVGLSVIGVLISVMLFVGGLDLSNDNNRINLWIYLKGVNGEK